VDDAFISSGHKCFFFFFFLTYLHMKRKEIRTSNLRFIRCGPNRLSYFLETFEHKFYSNLFLIFLI
jgi:hypothetical protein